MKIDTKMTIETRMSMVMSTGNDVSIRSVAESDEVLSGTVAIGTNSPQTMRIAARNSKMDCQRCITIVFQLLG